MWEGGYYIPSRSQFKSNVKQVEQILSEIGHEKSFKEILSYIVLDKSIENVLRVTACCRSYIKNGRPSTFADVHNYDD